MATWEHYKAGADAEAIAWLGIQGAADTKSGSDTNVRQLADPSPPALLVDPVVVGDAPVDDALAALGAATREALRWAPAVSLDDGFTRLAAWYADHDVEQPAVVPRSARRHDQLQKRSPSLR